MSEHPFSWNCKCADCFLEGGARMDSITPSARNAPSVEQPSEQTGLLPCPFCGETNIHVRLYNQPSVHCPNCLALGPAAQRLTFDSYGGTLNASNAKACSIEAISKWNTRTPQPTPAASEEEVIKRLETVARRLRHTLKGKEWTRRTLDADIIQNEIIPSLRAHRELSLQLHDFVEGQCSRCGIKAINAFGYCQHREALTRKEGDAKCATTKPISPEHAPCSPDSGSESCKPSEKSERSASSGEPESSTLTGSPSESFAPFFKDVEGKTAVELQKIIDAPPVAQAGQGECQICGHEWRRHDPEDGKCDAGPPCFCGHDMGEMRKRIAALSRAALSTRKDAHETRA